MLNTEPLHLHNNSFAALVSQAALSIYSGNSPVSTSRTPPGEVSSLATLSSAKVACPNPPLIGPRLPLVGLFYDLENLNSTEPQVFKDVLAIGSRFGTVDKACAYYDAAFCSSGRPDKTLQTTLEQSGFEVILCPHRGEKEVADKAMAVDAMGYAWEQPPPATVVLVTGDGDFADTAIDLHSRGIRVVLITPKSRRRFIDIVRQRCKTGPLPIIFDSDDIFESDSRPAKRLKSATQSVSRPSSVLLPISCRFGRNSAPSTSSKSKPDQRLMAAKKAAKKALKASKTAKTPTKTTVKTTAKVASGSAIAAVTHTATGQSSLRKPSTLMDEDIEMEDMELSSSTSQEFPSEPGTATGSGPTFGSGFNWDLAFTSATRVPVFASPVLASPVFPSGSGSVPLADPRPCSFQAHLISRKMDFGSSSVQATSPETTPIQSTLLFQLGHTGNPYDFRPLLSVLSPNGPQRERNPALGANDQMQKSVSLERLIGLEPPSSCKELEQSPWTSDRAVLQHLSYELSYEKGEHVTTGSRANHGVIGDRLQDHPSTSRSPRPYSFSFSDLGASPRRDEEGLPPYESPHSRHSRRFDNAPREDHGDIVRPIRYYHDHHHHHYHYHYDCDHDHEREHRDHYHPYHRAQRSRTDFGPLIRELEKRYRELGENTCHPSVLATAKLSAHAKREGFVDVETFLAAASRKGIVDLSDGVLFLFRA